MPSALAVRHVHFEDLGAFAAPLERRGFEIGYADAGDTAALAAADEADLLVVLGGPIGADDEADYPFLTDELAAIRRRLDAGRPLVGICLGAQLIARALGARVYPAAAAEIGWGKVELTQAGREGALAPLSDAPVLHWHQDTFDLPGGAVRLASTAVCPNQAFSLGEAVLALQFHPEVEAAGFEQWLIGHASEIAAAPGISASGLRTQAGEFAAASAATGEACFERWLSRIEVKGAPRRSTADAQS